MGKFWNAVKSGIGTAAHGRGPQQYQVGGHRIRCALCDHDRFASGKAQLHTAGMTFVGLDWAERSASTLACAECGRIEWFLQIPGRHQKNCC